MLQWMGGSRKKVTTSKKSLQKRQKQYFEQRRRQQQNQQIAAAGLDSSFDGGGNKKWEEESPKLHNKSLDILNLLNFSASSRESEHNCPSGITEERNVNTSTCKYFITMDAPIIQGTTVIPADSVEIEKTSCPSDYQTEILSPKKVPRVLPGCLDNHKSVYGSNEKSDPWGAATQKEVSVFDLLGDDEPNGYLEEGPTHEAHVAFSVDGVGKVESETPLQSPQQPDRYVSYGSFSPSKAARKLNLSRNRNSLLNDLELEVDAIMQDLEMPLRRSSLENSIGIDDSFSKFKKNSYAARDHIQHDGQGCKVRSSFSHGQAFCSTANNLEDLWDDRYSLSADFLDERQCGMSRESWSHHFDGDSYDYLNHRKPKYTFGDPHLLNKRDATKAAKRFSFQDSPPTKHHMSEDDYDFRNLRGARQRSGAINVCYEDAASIPDWCSFVVEDSRKSPSLLSEESCSSTAVRGEQVRS
ncbi:uncharacterized protein LOC126669314 isoform X2 [Mercurialis annua]|uniref:uncharacterized protein LOC126669314 isoform X2 n=1 Tax=Mercurialis annua TaxID=3986 RepID=UPI0024AD6F7C|nr:uncharacterized protein LOC126669314 isoform X2 [Mercurialis annua]